MLLQLATAGRMRRLYLHHWTTWRVKHDVCRKPPVIFPHLARRNSEGPQHDRADKNKRGADRQHIELHRNIHASYLHRSCACRKFSRKRWRPEANGLLQCRAIGARHFSLALCQHHEICRYFHFGEKVPGRTKKHLSAEPAQHDRYATKASLKRATEMNYAPPSINVTISKRGAARQRERQISGGRRPASRRCAPTASGAGSRRESRYSCRSPTGLATNTTTAVTRMGNMILALPSIVATLHRRTVRPKRQRRSSAVTSHHG